MNISSGIINKPVKVTLYGVEGIGKSTFASHFPKPLFIDLDNGTARLSVDRVIGIDSWKELNRTIHEFINMENNPYQTLVIDTADATARLCENEIITQRAPGKRSIEDIPYGKGYKMLAEEFSIFLVWLEEAINAGFNVVVLAHAIMRTVTKPDDMGGYDHWELKLPGNTTNKVGPLLKEWSDLLLFADYKTMLVTDAKTNKQKARGGERIMYTCHTPFADAKNRFGLPEVMPFDYKSIEKIVPAERTPTDITAAIEPEEPKTPLEQLRAILNRDSVTEKQLIDALATKSIHIGKLEEIPEKWMQEQIIDQWDTWHDYIINIPF